MPDRDGLASFLCVKNVIFETKNGGRKRIFHFTILKL